MDYGPIRCPWMPCRARGRGTISRMLRGVTMQVLVTGGAGYIGSHTAQLLVREGYGVTVLDNLSEGHDWAARWGTFVRGDLADADLVRSVLRQQRIEAVVHFAASAYVGESMQQPRKYYENNVRGTLSLLGALLDEGVPRIVFSSTCATYGEPERVPIPEDHPQRPVNPYGETKLAIERALRWYGQAYGLTYAALRYFNAAGADPDGEIGEEHRLETHLIPLAIQAALGQRERVEIFGTDYPTPDGTAIRDYIHVVDLARAHLAALERLAAGESFALNLGTGRGYSVREVIAMVQEVGGRPVPARATGRRPGDPPMLVADPSGAERLGGWRAACSDLRTIVDTAWRWHAARDPRGEWPPAGNP